MKHFEPRHCQQLMIAHILDHSRCNIWGDPGVGKTAATIAALDILWLTGSTFHPALVIAPLRVARDVWHQEVEKWAEFQHIRVSRIVGPREERLAAVQRPADIYTVNYENIQWLVDHWKERWPYRIVIADESTKLKNFRLRHGGKRARALAKVVKATGRWVNLTGTPASNGLIDLWGQNWFNDRGFRLGRTFTAYKDRWFIEDEYARTVSPLKNASTEIPEAIADVTISLEAKDYFDLPPLMHNTIPVHLPPKAQRWYDDMESRLRVELEEQDVSAANAAVRTTKCLQIAAGALYDDKGAWTVVHDAKIEALTSLLNDMAGQPLLCAYHWRADSHRLRQAFPESAREIKSERDVQDWNAGCIALGLVHPASVGHGLNLAEGGHQLVFFSLWWDLEQYLQIIERIGPTRQAQLGRQQPVTVHSLVAQGTLDEVVLERRQTKKSTQDLLRARMRIK